MYKKLLPNLIVLAGSTLIVSIVIFENLIKTVPSDMASTARISGYLTILISISIIPSLLYAALYLAKDFGKMMRIDVANDIFIKASKMFVNIYVVCEAVRLIVFFVFVFEYIKTNIANVDFLDSTMVANWEQTQYVINILFIICATLLFLFDIVEHSPRKIVTSKQLKLVVPLIFIQLLVNYKSVLSVFEVMTSWI